MLISRALGVSPPWLTIHWRAPAPASPPSYSVSGAFHSPARPLHWRRAPAAEGPLRSAASRTRPRGLSGKGHRVLILPAIDLRGGQCVRLRQGDYNQETVFGDDPAAMARRWVEQGAKYLHLVD